MYIRYVSRFYLMISVAQYTRDSSFRYTPGNSGNETPHLGTGGRKEMSSILADQ
jgi:hypothetical protein